MAKTSKNLFPRICALENLYTAARKARKRKTRKENVERFELHRERFLRQLHEELLTGRYRPSGYREFRIHDPKTRLIRAAPYRDRVVHHALCNVIELPISRRFVYESFSCQKGKGTGLAREHARRHTNRHRYVLKCDVRTFFHSIDHAVLLEKLGRVIGCRATLRLCARIIDSSRDEDVDCAAGESRGTSRPHGLPIGNLTSQLWANLFLDRLDHVIKEELRVKAYARYTDDFLLWADDKGFGGTDSGNRAHRGALAWRGASWNNNNQDNLRCENRNNINNASNRDNNNGFRLVLSRPAPVGTSDRSLAGVSASSRCRQRAGTGPPGCPVPGVSGRGEDAAPPRGW